LEHAADVFDKDHTIDLGPSVKELHAKIGQLSMENVFLSNALGFGEIDIEEIENGAEILDQKQIADFKELLMSEVIQSEALINLLDEKGIISREELLVEMKKVQASMIKAKK
jgi:hypothetical protein